LSSTCPGYSKTLVFHNSRRSHGKDIDVSDTDIETMDGEQYVTFELSNETYAIEALMVKEIIELAYVTRVPNLPEFFKGVINLRGLSFR